MRYWLLGSVGLLLVSVGCGGGGSAGLGGTSSGNGSGGGSPSSGVATASFRVDVNTRQVSITSFKGTNAKVFQGNSIGFNSTLLLDQPGDVGRKVLKVSLVNHTGETIGIDPAGSVNGLRVLFSGFTNIASFPDLRPQTQVTTFAGTGAIGSSDGATTVATFNGPHSATVATDGSVYVAEAAANKIRKISGGYVSTFAGSGVAGETDGLGAAATFNTPYGVALNPLDGSLIVTDFSGNKIRRVTVAGRVYTIAGTGTTGGANGLGSAATFDRPNAVKVDQYGHIYIVESAGRVRKILLSAGANPNLSGSYNVYAFAGANTPGFTDGIGTAAHFSFPSGVAVDPSGN